MKNRFALTGLSIVMALVATSVLLLTGCEGGGGGDSTPANVAGTWKGTGTIGDSSASHTLTLTQSGSSVSGTFDQTPVSGTVEGNDVLVSGSTVRNGVALWSKLDASVSGETMTGEKAMAIGNVGTEPIWMSSTIAISLTRVSN